jgi:hypothetical protein
MANVIFTKHDIGHFIKTHLMKKILVPILALSFFACSSPSNNADNSANADAQKEISPTRTEVKKEAVASYDVPLTGREAKLNNWHFTTQLFETTDRFRYRLEMQYEEMTGSDTITLPNLKMEPQPQIQKGDSDLEAIVGFLDQDGAFRKYILVSGKDGQLNMKTIQHYAVTEK